MAETKKGLNNKNLNKVSGGSSILDGYPKIAKKDKDEFLVDYGSGVEIDLNPSIQYDEHGNLLVVKREKDPPTIGVELFVTKEK